MVGKDVKHSKSDALNQREFQLLLEGAEKLDKVWAMQAKFIILVGGRLGLRRAEIAHMEEDWIDWRRNMIEIPRHDPCTKGREGGICGDCEQNAQQRVNHNPDMAIEEARELAWMAKTDEAAREVPFDFDPRVELEIERFFDTWDKYPRSVQSVNRRVNEAVSRAEGIDADEFYPHALRATAASYHAGRGLGVLPLQSLMGWSQVSTAHNYVQQSGENTARALHFTHSQ